jgi:hypothetical protein
MGGGRGRQASASGPASALSGGTGLWLVSQRTLGQRPAVSFGAAPPPQPGLWSPWALGSCFGGTWARVLCACGFVRVCVRWCDLCEGVGDFVDGVNGYM